MKLFSVLKEEINRKRMMDKLKEMGFDDYDAEIELDNLIDSLNNLPEYIKLYRIVIANSKSDIDLDKPGSHYSISKSDLLSSHSYLTGYGEKYYLITVKAPKNLIDFQETLENNILYPNEQEITLKNKGKGVDVISVTKLNV